MSIDFDYRNILISDDFDLTSYTTESIFSIQRYNIILGYSYIDLIKPTKKDNLTSNGLISGLGIRFYDPVTLTMISKVTFYKNLTEYYVELNKDFNRINVFTKYNKVGNYEELSIGIGIEWTYYFKYQKEANKGKQ